MPGAELAELGGVRGGRFGQALLGSLLAGDGLGEAGGDLLPFPGGVGAELVQVTCGGLAGPPGLLSVGAGLVPGVLGGADEGLSLGAGPLDRFPRCRLRGRRACPGLGDGSGLAGLGGG